jgi:hypothetical protein
VHTEDSDSVILKGLAAALPALSGLRLIPLNSGETPQRRRFPRRRIVARVHLERRQADRRRAKPGIDGLLRTVLADNWT